MERLGVGEKALWRWSDKVGEEAVRCEEAGVESDFRDLVDADMMREAVRREGAAGVWIIRYGVHPSMYLEHREGRGLGDGWSWVCSLGVGWKGQG